MTLHETGQTFDGQTGDSGRGSLWTVLVAALVGVTLTAGCREVERQEPPAEVVDEAAEEQSSPEVSREPAAPAPTSDQAAEEEATDAAASPSGSGPTGSAGPAAPSAADTARETGAPTQAQPKFTTPDRALRFASQQRSTAARHAEEGDNAKAYTEALEGWQSLRPHLADRECQRLSAELLAEIEVYGEGLASPSGSVLAKPLKIK